MIEAKKSAQWLSLVEQKDSAVTAAAQNERGTNP